MGGTACPVTAVVGAAGVGRFLIAAAHGEHGCAAVAAGEKAGVHIVILLDALYRDDGPHRFDGAPVFGPGGFLPAALGHAGCRDALFGEIVGDLLVAPALLVVKTENGTDNVGFKHPHHNAGSSYQQKLLSHMGQLLRNRFFQLVTDNNCINGIQASNRKHGAGLELGMVAKENAL